VIDISNDESVRPDPTTTDNQQMIFETMSGGRARVGSVSLAERTTVLNEGKWSG
jgi:hypothetical protein